MAEREFERLSNLGLFKPAAKAYCRKYRGGVLWIQMRGYWKSFGSVEECETGIVAALHVARRLNSIGVVVTIDVDEAEQTCTTTGENVTINLRGDDNEMHSYECLELRGKMSGREYE